MKNKLTDLNNHLFAQLERLGDESLKGEELLSEIERARAISIVAKDVTANANLVLQACKFAAEQGQTVTAPRFLGLENG